MATISTGKSRINIDPAIMHGRPVIQGRRVLVEMIVGALAGGDSIQDVCEAYMLTKTTFGPLSLMPPTSWPTNWFMRFLVDENLPKDVADILRDPRR